MITNRCSEDLDNVKEKKLNPLIIYKPPSKKKPTLKSKKNNVKVERKFEQKDKILDTKSASLSKAPERKITEFVDEKKIGNSLCVGVRHNTSARIIWLLKSDVRREN